MARRSGAWAGWVAFAGGLLLMLGVLNLFYGFFGLFEDEVLVASEGQLMIVDLTAWAIITLIFGVVQILTGIGLFMANNIARIVAIVLAVVHAAYQLTGFAAYPFWSTLMIALDVIVLYALTVRWSDVVETFDEETILAQPPAQDRYAPPPESMTAPAAGQAPPSTSTTAAAPSVPSSMPPSGPSADPRTTAGAP